MKFNVPDDLEQPHGNHIEQFFHCTKCIKEKPDDISPRDWIKNEVGWTTDGMQVWCIRHEMNVVEIDYKGQKVSYK